MGTHRDKGQNEIRGVGRSRWGEKHWEAHSVWIQNSTPLPDTEGQWDSDNRLVGLNGEAWSQMVPFMVNMREAGFPAPRSSLLLTRCFRTSPGFCSSVFLADPLSSPIPEPPRVTWLRLEREVQLPKLCLSHRCHCYRWHLFPFSCIPVHMTFGIYLLSVTEKLHR